MNKDWQKQLAGELKSAGASSSDIEQLLPIAVSLRQLKVTGKPAVKMVRHEHSFRIRVLAFACVAGLLASCLLSIVSQSVLPSSKLYPVQKISDNVRTSIQPGYRATVMMKRAEQVNELARQHADSKTILAAIGDYNEASKSYNNLEQANFAAYKYCESNLTQAAKNVSPDVRREISKSLQALDAS